MSAAFVPFSIDHEMALLANLPCLKYRARRVGPEVYPASHAILVESRVAQPYRGGSRFGDFCTFGISVCHPAHVDAMYVLHFAGAVLRSTLMVE